MFRVDTSDMISWKVITSPPIKQFLVMGKPADLVVLVQVYFQRETSDTYKHMSVETVTV